MRVTEATMRAAMQEFIQRLFDRTDPLGYDVTAVPHGPFIWRVTIENLHEKDVYDVEYNQNGWQWLRVITPQSAGWAEPPSQRTESGTRPDEVPPQEEA
ncbi:hypothetical protein uav_069 [Pseudomonas phage UAVern]|uniref:Uncharacterized protein n=1 Tax=Pseudomonas phage UAVern TaxID=2856997 RepID=A0A975YYJ1_9CAUD|nr:hypothetical protein uav_069 [Pseudomonas phage UAVern]